MKANKIPVCPGLTKLGLQVWEEQLWVRADGEQCQGAIKAGIAFIGSAGCCDAVQGLDVGLRNADVDSGKVRQMKMCPSSVNSDMRQRLHDLNKSWKEVLQKEDSSHHHEPTEEQHQPNRKGSSFADSMDLTAAVHSYTQHGGFISPFDIFAFQSVRQEG